MAAEEKEKKAGELERRGLEEKGLPERGAAGGKLAPGDIVDVGSADCCPACGRTRYSVHVVYETGCGVFGCLACSQARWLTGLDDYTLVE